MLQEMEIVFALPKTLFFLLLATRWEKKVA